MNRLCWPVFGILIFDFSMTARELLEATVVVDHTRDEGSHIGMSGAHTLDMDTNLG